MYQYTIKVAKFYVSNNKLQFDISDKNVNESVKDFVLDGHCV